MFNYNKKRVQGQVKAVQIAGPSCPGESTGLHLSMLSRLMNSHLAVFVLSLNHGIIAFTHPYLPRRGTVCVSFKDTTTHCRAVFAGG
jgi:hypothetical protein